LLFGHKDIVVVHGLGGECYTLKAGAPKTVVKRNLEDLPEEYG
jgi:hypothetical protein